MPVSLFALCSSMFGEVVHYLYSLFAHCSFSHLFDWCCFCYCLMSFLAVFYSYCFLCGCCLTDCCWCELCLYMSGFQSVIECHPEDLPLCVCPTDPKGIVQLLSVLALCACCSWWSVACLCYAYCIWSVVVGMVTLSCYCTMGP